MKILVLQSELGVLRGGGENFTRNLFSAFAERGHSVTAAFLADHRGEYPIALPPRIRAIPISGWWSRNPGQAIFSSVRSYLPPQKKTRATWDRIQEAISWRTIRWHNRRFQRRVERDFAGRWCNFDAVYVHANAALASKIARHRPTILRLPGPTSAEAAPVLRQVHAVCANGDALAVIRRFLGDHAVELPVGIDTDRFRPDGPSIRSDLGWKDHDKIVGYAGRLTHLKGVDILAAGFHEISRLIPDAKLLIIGSGAEEKYVRIVLSKEISQRRVHIEPDLDHEKLPYWYRAMDVFVMPSRYENFSNAIIEAMACGVPFLASDTGGNRLLSAAGTGRLFQPASVFSLSSSLREILQNNSEVAALRVLASGYARNCYSWNASAERLETIISSRLSVNG